MQAQQEQDWAPLCSADIHRTEQNGMQHNHCQVTWAYRTRYDSQWATVVGWTLNDEAGSNGHPAVKLSVALGPLSLSSSLMNVIRVAYVA